MKAFLILIFLSVLSTAAFAQHIASPADEATKNNIPLEKLDEMYPSAVGEVFKDNTAAFIDAYRNMLSELAVYLKKNGFEWPASPFRAVNKIYFKPDGSIDYFIFSFDPVKLNPVQQDKFNTLLNSFIQTYQIGIQAKKPFSQCGAVKYTN